MVDVKKVGAYVPGCNYIVLKDRIQPLPQKYQKGIVRFSNNPDNKIHGLEKLNSIKVS